MKEHNTDISFSIMHLYSNIHFEITNVIMLETYDMYCFTTLCFPVIHFACPLTSTLQSVADV